MTTELNSSNYVPPKVFISYSWTSDEYAEWIKGLAAKLRNNGVDVILDRWKLKPGQDKYAFMEQMVTDPEIKKVLVMCDKRYAERADRREGGVGTESTIISQEVYNQVGQKKFIPVVTERGPGGEMYLPAFIKEEHPNAMESSRTAIRAIWRTCSTRCGVSRRVGRSISILNRYGSIDEPMKSCCLTRR